MKRTIEITCDLSGLMEAAETILDGSPTRGPVIEGIKQRIKWKQVQEDYKELRQENLKRDRAFRVLSERYHYSTKTIAAIVYER